HPIFHVRRTTRERSDGPAERPSAGTPIFHVLYDVREVPQIPSIGFWFGTGGRTSERGADSAVVHARAITDREGHMLVVMTHHTDFGDAFEREGENRAYFDQFAAPGYAVGVNV